MQLIKLKNTTIGAEVKETVNARDLHSFLESKADFSTWIKNQIERARLIENRDFVTVTKKVERQILVDYHLTIEAGKSIGMMSATDKGFEIRDYFLDCERRAKSPGIHELLNNPNAMHTVLLDYSSKIIERDKLISIISPKAAIADRIETSEGLFGFRQIAKILSINENKLRAWLIHNDWIYYLGGRMTAKAPKLRSGYLDSKVKLIQIDGHDDKTIVDMFFTSKGLHKLTEMFCQAEIAESA